MTNLNAPKIILYEVTGMFILYLGCRMALEFATGNTLQALFLAIFTQATKIIWLYVITGLILIIMPLLIWLFGYWKRFVFATSILLAVLGCLVTPAVSKIIYFAVAIMFAVICFLADPE